MFANFKELVDKLLNKKNYRFLSDYEFCFVTSNIDFSRNEKIFTNIKQSKIIIIDRFESKYFIISFKKTLIVIGQLDISYLRELFSYNPELTICFLNNAENIFTQYFNIAFNKVKCEKIYEEEISCIVKHFAKEPEPDEQIRDFFSIICPCIAGYLIKQSYLKLNENRFKSFEENQMNKNQNQTKIFKKDEFISLPLIGIGSIFAVDLVYHISTENIFALKKPNIITNETTKLINREKDNYKNINHPLFPKFICSFVDDEKDYLIIEYINGKTLDRIEEIKFNNEDEKIIILFQLIMAVKYIHSKNLILRDLKPNNIIIDQNKTAVIIDFDRCINKNDINSSQNTNDFGAIYMAPEVNSGNFSNKCDIYSLGQIIFYLLGESFTKYPQLYGLYTLCTYKIDPEIRPSSIELYCLFYEMFKQQLNNFVLQSKFIFDDLKKANSYFTEKYGGKQPIRRFKTVDPNDYDQVVKSHNYFLKLSKENPGKAEYFKGLGHYEGIYDFKDINKAIYHFQRAASYNNPEAFFKLGEIFQYTDIKKSIYYYSQAAQLNHKEAQFILGNIYNENNDVKAIYYYEQAAKQNHFVAQFNLGRIFYEGKLIKKDINKSIYFYSLSAKQNFDLAQFNLGLIYYYGESVQKNIKTAIYYFQQAAKQNNCESLNLLAKIYFEAIYVPRDVYKAIYYLEKSAEQKNASAQYSLGRIFFINKYIKADPKKAIYYFKLAAEQNEPNAQYHLANCYYEGKFIQKDVNKAIHYYKLSANQNNIQALNKLSLIYLEGFYVKFDIDKIIYYLMKSANQNNAFAQFMLASFYLDGKIIKRNINQGLSFLFNASTNGFNQASFALGSLYHEGKFIKCDIIKAIHYYKEASSMNEKHAINNLGIIYKNGFGSIIIQNTASAEEYLTEASKLNDGLSLYNLSHIYLYDESNLKIDEAINLLILSSNQGFNPSNYLLCLALIKKYDFDFDAIKNELTNKSPNLSNKIFQIIKDSKLNDKANFIQTYENFRSIDFVYDYSEKWICSKLFINQKNNISVSNQHKKDISSSFYEGFGIDLK